jgi:hypothetical protein
MADITSVGAHLSVGADVSPDATANFNLVVLAAKERQHDVDRFPTKVYRCPLSDDGVPTTAEVKRAQECAALVAWTIAPEKVPWAIWVKLGKDKMFDGVARVEITKANVLITCEAGLDRSCWIAAMVLVLIGEQRTGKEAREHIQKIRGPKAFSNAGMKQEIDKFYPEELAAIRLPGLDVSTHGFSVR